FHFADIPIQKKSYEDTFPGANDHDVVHAIDACIAVLQGKPAPQPFDIASKKEALMLLVHFVGDLHQPLHVGAEYLSAKGAAIEPAANHVDPKTDTHGGNSIAPGSNNLHHRWDQTRFLVKGDAPSTLKDAAKKTAVGPVDPKLAAAKWASDTVSVADTK